MSIRSEILDYSSRSRIEQGKRLGPLSDELPPPDSGLDTLCFAILVSRLEIVLGVDPFSENTVALFL
jgi:hypothetical protein